MTEADDDEEWAALRAACAKRELALERTFGVDIGRARIWRWWAADAATTFVCSVYVITALLGHPARGQ